MAVTFPLSELPTVNQAGINRKEYVHNWGGLAGEARKGQAVTTNREKSAEVIVPT